MDKEQRASFLNLFSRGAGAFAYNFADIDEICKK